MGGRRLNPSKRKVECSSCHEIHDEEDMVCNGCSTALQEQEFETGFNDGKKEGYKEGYDEGYEKGFMEGIKEAVDRIQRELNSVERQIK